jgi:anthranilate phosphoribosyltransferase
MSDIIRAAITNLIQGKNLSRIESKKLMLKILNGEVTDAQISAFLVALRMKGETVEEVAGVVEAVNTKTQRVITKIDDLVDTCGTGEDNLNTFNISTAAALVAAGAGVIIAKHCNRSVSSKCGSADVLMALNVNLDLSPSDLSRCLTEIGIAFLFAPRLHQTDRYAMGPRQEIGVRTIFNLLNPLTNPAGIKRQLIGVYDRGLVRLVVEVLKELESVQVMVVHGCEGMDEISISGPTIICELIDDNIYEYMIRPENFGMETAPVQQIQTRSIKDNKRLLLDVLQGIPSAALNTVLLNAGAAIKVSGQVDSIWEGISQARQSIESGAARKKLEQLIEFTNRINLAQA